MVLDILFANSWEGGIPPELYMLVHHHAHICKRWRNGTTHTLCVCTPDRQFAAQRGFDGVAEGPWMAMQNARLPGITLLCAGCRLGGTAGRQ